MHNILNNFFFILFVITLPRLLTIIFDQVIFKVFSDFEIETEILFFSYALFDRPSFGDFIYFLLNCNICSSFAYKI